MNEAIRTDSFSNSSGAWPIEAARSVGGSPEGAATSPARIEPLREEVVRPFWSVMIPVYNCSEIHLRETLLSVLCQDPGVEEMQIEVIDNCSTKGDPEAIVRELGNGRIDFHRQHTNVGMAENFNACVRRARGEWVHILHSDDTVRPGFYDRQKRGFAASRDVGAALCRLIYSDVDGQWTGLAELEARHSGVLDDGFAVRQFLEQRVQFVAIVVRRSTYEELGAFRPSLTHCLDWDMWKRIAVRKPIFYNPEPLACYRLHAGAESSRLMSTGRNVVDERRSIEFSCADDPARHHLRSAAYKEAGVRSARRAHGLWKSGQHAAAWRQLHEALRCSFAPAVLARVLYFLLRTVIR